MSMYTDPNHLKVSDPGNTKDNPVFMYLSCFANDEHFTKYLPDYKNLDEMKAHYERGGLGDMKCKRFLFSVMDEILTPFREKRKYYEEHIEEVYKILEEGTKKAIEYSNVTLEKVKKAMRIDYFSNDEFLNELKEKYNK